MYNFGLILYGHINQKEEDMTVCGKRKEREKERKVRERKELKNSCRRKSKKLFWLLFFFGKSAVTEEF